MRRKIIDHGSTGFVELRDNLAIKYIEFSGLYWIREYSVLSYLWPFNTENIIKYYSGSFVKEKDPKGRENSYYKIIFPRYSKALSDIRINRDVQIIQIMLDLLSAVKFLHSERIMHRDIKPDNIMMHDKRAVLIDFSHAIRERSTEIVLDEDVVTYTYRAPELYNYALRNVRNYNNKVDIWSIGLILFQMVTGKELTELYDDNSELDVGNEFMSKDFNKKLNTYYYKYRNSFYYYQEYHSWINKMLVQDPEQRISAAEMYDNILKFSNTTNMTFIVPVNESCKIRTVSLTTNTISNSELMTVAYSKLRYVRTKCEFKYTYTSMCKVISHLISTGTINKHNIYVMITAASIVVDVFIFDNIAYSLNYVCNELSLTKKNIKKAIIELVQKHDLDLFARYTFNFYENIDKELAKHGISDIKDIVIAERKYKRLIDVMID